MTTAARPAVLCVGRLYCDLIFTNVPRMPTLGTEVFTGGLGIHAGGGGPITAAWLASLGHATTLASYLPAEPFRDHLSAEIARAGVDLSLSRPAAADLDPQLTVSIVASEDRAFLTRRPGAPCPDLTVADIRRAGVGHVHIGELSTLIERPGLLAAAREAGVTVSLDCGWDETLERAEIGQLLAGIDVFLPNAAEADHLDRLGVPARAAKLAVIKRGAGGASALVDGTEIHDPALGATPIDSTGAGDAFNAGFLSAWLAAEPLAGCLRAGNATGARAIARRGGFPAAEAAPTRASALTP